MVDDWTLRPRNWLAGFGEKFGEKSVENATPTQEIPRVRRMPVAHARRLWDRLWFRRDG
jgi:hypothetical protein